MIRLISIWIAMLGAFGALWGGNSASANVRVEEVTISLYNKPVTGFRVVLDRSQSVVSRKIIEHVAQVDDAKPFEYERTIIFENIRYSPITAEQDISLYFLLRGLQGQYTELTYVAMYDYKRSVSTRQFPRLSLLLQIDLARMVRAITGDIMESGDVVFDDRTLQQLSAQGPDTGGESDLNPEVEHYREEEVENASVLIRQDPFEPKTTAANRETTPAIAGGDTTVLRLQKRIKELEAREQQLIASETSLRAEQDAMARKQELMMAKVRENKSLRDSIVLLNQRVQGMLGQYYVSDDISVSNETAERLFELERINEQNERRIALLERANDSLSRVAGNMRNQLASLSDSRRTQAEKLVELEKENSGLTAELSQVRNRNVALEQASQGNRGIDSLLNILAQSRERSQGMQARLTEGEQETTRLKEENDWLTGKKLQLEDRIRDLESENRDLHKQMDATMPGTVIIDDNPGRRDSLSRLLRDSREEYASLEQDLTIAKGEQLRLEQQMGVLRREKQQLAGQVNELEKELATLRKSGGHSGTAGEEALRDSLQLMRQRMRNLQGQEAENARLQQQLEEQKGQLATRSAEIKRINADLEQKKNALSQADNQVQSLNRQLAESKREQEGMQRNLQQKQGEVERLNEEKQLLNQRIEKMRTLSGKSDAQLQTLLDSIDALQKDKASLNRDIVNRDRQMRRQIVKTDSLQGLIVQGENNRNELRRQLDQMQSRIDSLSRATIPQNDQQQFMREQWSKLQQWEKDLNARDKTIADKEKLLEQRQSFLDKKESTLAGREEELKGLQAREESLRLREQELNAREGSSGLMIRTEQIELKKVMEFGNMVPVFEVVTPLRYKLAQKQVVAYMLGRNEILDEQFPDILYRSVMFPDLDLQPVEFRVRISSEGTGTVMKFSFRLADGTYLGDNSSRKVIDKAKQLISNLLRYRYQG